MLIFHTPSRPDVKILSNFSLSVPFGKTIALVGSSGSGKSTVVSLIERFYDPTSGQILHDGHDIKTLKLRWLRQQIGLVSQEPALFATTIKENILLGRPDATLVEVEEAARVANLHSFIVKLPDGFDTQEDASSRGDKAVMSSHLHGDSATSMPDDVSGAENVTEGVLMAFILEAALGLWSHLWWKMMRL